MRLDSDDVLEGFYWGTALVLVFFVGWLLTGCSSTEQLEDAGAGDAAQLEDVGQLEDAGRACSGGNPCPWGYVCTYQVNDAGMLVAGFCEASP